MAVTGVVPTTPVTVIFSVYFVEAVSPVITQPVGVFVQVRSAPAGVTLATLAEYVQAPSQAVTEVHLAVRPVFVGVSTTLLGTTGVDWN